MTDSDRQLSVMEHLREFRSRLMWSALAIAIGSIIAFIFYRQILDVLKRPLLHAVGSGVEPEWIVTGLTDALSITFKVSIIAGLVMAFPLVLYEVIMFVAPGLTKTERRYLLAFIPGVALAFVGGVAFAYFVMLPPALGFLYNFAAGIARPMIVLGGYINLVTMLLFWVGVVFETPVVMFLLARLGVVNHRAFGRFRRVAVVGAFILGALITPTFDPINQSLVALPIIVLYEVGILLARLADRLRRGSAKVRPAARST